MVTGELAQWLEDHKEECGKMALALMINQLKEETREDGRRQAFEDAAQMLLKAAELASNTDCQSALWIWGKKLEARAKGE